MSHFPPCPHYKCATAPNRDHGFSWKTILNKKKTEGREKINQQTQKLTGVSNQAEMHYFM